MIILQILITLAGIYLYVLMGFFTNGLIQKLWEDEDDIPGFKTISTFFIVTLWPAFLAIYITFACLGVVLALLIKGVDFAEKLGGNLGAYSESENENEKKGK